MTTIVVPVSSGQAVEIPTSDLPPAQDLIRFLTDEKAALSIWMDVAVCISWSHLTAKVQYYKHSRLDDFKAVLECFTEATSESVLLLFSLF